MAQVDSVGMIFTHMAQSCKPSWFGKGRGSIRHKGSIRQMSHRRVYEYSQPLLEDQAHSTDKRAIRRQKSDSHLRDLPFPLLMCAQRTWSAAVAAFVSRSHRG